MKRPVCSSPNGPRISQVREQFAVFFHPRWVYSTKIHGRGAAKTYGSRATGIHPGRAPVRSLKESRARGGHRHDRSPESITLNAAYQAKRRFYFATGGMGL